MVHEKVYFSLKYGVQFIESMMQVFNIQEKSDWIIYNRYIQRDLELCKLLIDQELRNTKDNNEFAFYILVNTII